MSIPNLPKRASLEYLKKLAKERLRDLRRTDPAAQAAGCRMSVPVPKTDRSIGSTSKIVEPSHWDMTTAVGRQVLPLPALLHNP